MPGFSTLITIPISLILLAVPLWDFLPLPSVCKLPTLLGHYFSSSTHASAVSAPVSFPMFSMIGPANPSLPPLGPSLPHAWPIPYPWPKECPCRSTRTTPSHPLPWRFLQLRHAHAAPD